MRGDALIATAFSGCSDTCQNRTVSRAEAPSGGLKAVLFQRDCGATTGFSSQVSVTDADDVPTGGGNVFVADTDQGTASATTWGGPWVEMRWLSPGNLLIRYDARARVFTQNESVAGCGLDTREWRVNVRNGSLAGVPLGFFRILRRGLVPGTFPQSPSRRRGLAIISSPKRKEPTRRPAPIFCRSFAAGGGEVLLTSRSRGRR